MVPLVASRSSNSGRLLDAAFGRAAAMLDPVGPGIYRLDDGGQPVRVSDDR
jgi:hypothetical protein